ncbi:MAG: glutamine-hydrolyzing carbamoyl-phosphate synthase small subunit [Gammaproteobacteria bacterium]|nr:glutamine-hydrolyzing carbamoyl-phosphate synthase small subunit [Gammaproteobacteria bacterium]
MNIPALLVLEDGSTFPGKSIGAPGASVGEVVFNTSMTGYQEILTDPSYARQLVTLTYPQIGNVGVNAEDMESSRVFCAGLIIRNLPHRDSNWRSEGTLEHWLQEQGVVAIGHIDTRRLTRLIRTKGAQSGCIVADGTLDAEAALVSAKAFPGLAGMDLAKEVCVTRSYPWNAGTWSLGSGYTTPQTARFKVVAYDFGIKHNLLRLLSDRGCRLTVVPAYTEAEQVIAENPDGVFLSNGPGDPEPCGYAIAAIRKILDRNIPVFGICLGHQLLALASGARTVKMKFGHHGANHPVQDLDSGQVLITSQNHGFAVDEDSIGDAVKITHRSLFDGTVQGIERLDKPAFSFQGHPEASPGPHDIGGLFDRFVAMMASKTQSEVHAQEN